MDGTDFSFETLSKQEALERKQPKLTRIEPSFWDHVQSYLRGLESALRKEQERNPTSRKIALLQDEFRNATRKTESLWEAREKKVTLYALKNARAADAPPPEDALGAERELFHALVAAYRQSVPRVIQLLEKSADWVPAAPASLRPTSSAAPSPPIPATPTSAVPPSPAQPPATVAASAPRPTDDSITVRALVDVPPFVGLDGRTYRLKKGDVLVLPRKMVDLLAKRGQVALMA